MNKHNNILSQSLNELQHINYIELLDSLNAKFNISATEQLFVETLKFIFNKLMQIERKIYLQQNPNKQANGFYERNLFTIHGKIPVSVPRVRNDSFRPEILPPKYKRYSSSLIKKIILFYLNGLTSGQIKQILYELNLPYTPSIIEEIANQLKQDLEDFKTQQLPENMFMLVIDGYHTKLKYNGRVRNAVLYVVIGIDFNGVKHPIHFELMLGGESKNKWIDIFHNIINRGLKKVMLIVSDDLPGIDAAIKGCFPNSLHQICFVHLKKRIRTKLPQHIANDVLKTMDKIKKAQDYEEGEKLFDEMVEKYSKKYSLFFQNLKDKKEQYICFLNFPEKVRKNIYSTNLIESVNRLIEKRRDNIGGYFPSNEILELNVYAVLINLYKKWKNKPIPLIKSSSYELRQMFYLKFNQEV